MCLDFAIECPLRRHNSRRPPVTSLLAKKSSDAVRCPEIVVNTASTRDFALRSMCRCKS